MWLWARIYGASSEHAMRTVCAYKFYDEQKNFQQRMEKKNGNLKLHF